MNPHYLQGVLNLCCAEVTKLLKFQPTEAELATKLKFDSSWNVMAHGDAPGGSEGETGEWSG